MDTEDDADPYTFQVGLVDAKSLAGEDIIVTYSGGSSSVFKIEF